MLTMNILLSKLGHDINYHKSPKNSYLIKFYYYYYVVKPKIGYMSPIHTSHSFLKPKTTYTWQYFKSPISLAISKTQFMLALLKAQASKKPKIITTW